jgi:hypothetical protein
VQRLALKGNGDFTDTEQSFLVLPLGEDNFITSAENRSSTRREVVPDSQILVLQAEVQDLPPSSFRQNLMSRIISIKHHSTIRANCFGNQCFNMDELLHVVNIVLTDMVVGNIGDHSNIR